MTDSPLQPHPTPPPSPWQQVEATIGNLARPFAIYAVAFASAKAIVILARLVGTLAEAAIYIGAVLGGLAAIYGVKSWENAKATKHTAEIEKAKAAGPVDFLPPSQ